MATLQNKTVVVVGGSSGIGFATALAALQAQASTVIIASSSAERVAGAVERLKSHKLPGDVRGEVLDAKDSAAIKAFSERIGSVDHVAWTSGDVPDFTAPQHELMANAFTVRYWGPFILSQNLKFNEGGSLTLTGGPTDLKPGKGETYQSGACAAVDGLAKGLAVDLAPVRVNTVAPGGIETEIWDKFPAILKQMRSKMEERLLIKRIGEPSEVAEAFIFLMKCGYITGQRINVDGGYALGG